MSKNFRFAIVSDPHVALPHTIWDNPSRFHQVEVSISALEIAIAHLAQENIDFLLIPGDLTQHGEPENHAWLSDYLAKLPFPVYVVPGNHDVPVLLPDKQSIGLADFPHYYGKFGYDNPKQLYYTCEVLPGVRLIGLNSNQFDDDGKQIPVGRLDEQQLSWLQQVLDNADEPFVMVMIHHNIVEHLPGQSCHALGRRYMLENASVLLPMLQDAGVQLAFTGHLHVQDTACNKGLYDITTGSLVSYPHPYRILNFHENDRGIKQLKIESYRVESLPDRPNFSESSREWIGDRSRPFMLKLLTDNPLNLPLPQAEQLVSDMRYFWADIAAGDALFDFSHFPDAPRRYLEAFSACNPNGQPIFIDNDVTLLL